jgi:hypothetical protein
LPLIFWLEELATFMGSHPIPDVNRASALLAACIILTTTGIAGVGAGSNTGGIQELIDSCPPSVASCVITLKPATYNTRSTIWLHSGVHLQGAGPGLTLIRRLPGSIRDTDANNSGAVIAVSQRGKDGTLPTPSDTLSDITLSDLSIDGSYKQFLSLTNVNIGAFGVAVRYTDGFTLRNVTIQSVLQDGLQIVSSRNVQVAGLVEDTVGHWGVTSTRNAISLYNYSSDTAWNTNVALSGIVLTNIGNEAIAANGWSHVEVTGLVVDGCDFIFELGNSQTPGVPVETDGWTVSGVVARNVRSYFVTLNAGPTMDYRHLHFSDFRAEGDLRHHNGGAIYMNAGSSGDNLTDISFDDFVFTNINTADLNPEGWINIQPSASATVSGIRLSNGTMSGLASSRRTGDTGILVSGNVHDLEVSNVLMKDVPGIGIGIDDSTYPALEGPFRFYSVTVDGANYFCTRIRNDDGATRASDILFVGSTMKDCAKQGAGSNAGFSLVSTAPGSSITDVRLINCRSYRTMGFNHAYGLSLWQSAGTISDITVSDSDFSGTASGWFQTSGVVTGFHFFPKASPGGRTFRLSGANALPRWDRGDTSSC